MSMRRAAWYGAGAAIVAAVELAMCLTPAAGTGGPRLSAGPDRPTGGHGGSADAGGSAGSRGSAGTAIFYRGLHLRVPAGWPVFHLDADPTRCVRFDRHAVYLGRGGSDQNCPGRPVGRTEAGHREPMGPGDNAPA